MLRTITASLALLAVTSFVSAQAPVNGPMPGHADFFEATIWMQCHGPCTAQIDYWPVLQPDSIRSTPPQQSDPRQAHAMDFVLDHIAPGTEYGYRAIVNGKPIDFGEQLTLRTQPLWKFRSDPPDFTVALGSCAYINEPPYDRPGKPYGAEYGIFNSIADKHPDLMLWLGDNIYLREPDWGSRTGYLHRYTHTRSTAEMQRLLRGTQHCAIWDDHDFGPNDADGSWVNATLARDLFDLFWPNPGCGVPGAENSTAAAFSHLDVDFFLLDNRTYRVPADVVSAEPTMLGKAQIDWLIRALKYSDASFKLVAVGSQVLSESRSYENFSAFERERGELLRRLDEEGIRNVVFLTGDRHFTELSSMRQKNGLTLYDLTCSSLTSGTYKATTDNPLRVEGTAVEERRNFATLSFSGPKKERQMTIRVFDSEGMLIWERTVQQEKKP